MAAGPIARAAVCSRAVDGWVAKRRSAGGTEPNSLLSNDVRFSNRPFGVKRFQTIRTLGVDVARGLVLLFGIGTKALVWGFFCQGVRQSGKSFVLRQFLCSISKPVSSSRPAGSLTSSRAGAVKVGRRANLAACSELARPYLDSFEHDGTLGAIGMTIRGEPAFGRGSVAPQPCIRWVQGPEP